MDDSPTSIKDAEEYYKCCADKHPMLQYHCERRKNHDGVHQALDGDVEW